LIHQKRSKAKKEKALFKITKKSEKKMAKKNIIKV
jgi:hypothetical protein